MPPHIISIGEILVEIMRPDVSQPLDRPGMFAGPYASGAPAIFAVAAARLGMSVGFIGGVGNDAFGKLLRARLTSEGVDTTLLQTVPGYTTGIAFIAYAPDGNREFVFHLHHSAAAMLNIEELTPDDFTDVHWLHLSGSAMMLSKASRTACQRALELTLAAGGRLSLDPNLRPELMPLDEARRMLAPYLATADLILPTAAEAHALTGTENDEKAAHALLTWGNGNPNRIVALKRGAKGCTLFTTDTRIDIPGFAVQEIDPTGAGDCFNAGCVLGLEMGWSPEEIARFAAAAGALAVTQQGPMEGAPTRAEVESLMRC